MLRFFIFFALALAPVTSSCAAPAPLLEISVDTEQTLIGAIRDESALPIIVQAGRYDLTDVKIPHDTMLIGRGHVIFYSSAPTQKGILNPLPGANLHVENITFKGATSPDLNGAGIRHDGEDLTIINCRFNNNENGVLSTGTEDGRIKITGSSFIENGHGDGYSHGIYVVDAASLEINASEFIGTKIGHHVKSLAAQTKITGTVFDDAEGETSYALDASKGGDVVISGNRITQAASASNATIINYDLSRGGAAISLEISGNQIINHRANATLLRNATPMAAVIENNQIRNEGRGALKAP
ncbi:MAG: hypothetical protein DHS20C05_00940 [Hyphococcus sp.]|nr:MAG: hypothetical protein DHS20C05_00940 [Marinicaulis sp.]